MIAIKIDLLKVSKMDLFKGEKGTYLDLLLFDKPDQYGNSGYVVQGISKEKRLAGEKGQILGNWKELETKKPVAKPTVVKAEGEEDDGLPW